MLAWIEQKNNGVLLRVLIQAGASTTEITALHGDPPRLKIRLAAPPRDGEANAALLRYLKTCLKPLIVQIHIVRGELNKKKDLLITGSTQALITEALKKIL